MGITLAKTPSLFGAGDLQDVHGPGDADIEQPTFLGNFIVVVEVLSRRENAVFTVRQ